MVYVKKRQKESTESLLRRFSRKVQSSGVLNVARDSRYFEKPVNKRARRQRAIRGTQIRKEIEYLKKIGKLPEEYGPHSGRRRRRR